MHRSQKKGCRRFFCRGGTRLEVVVRGVEARHDGLHQRVRLELDVRAHELEEEAREDHLEGKAAEVANEALDALRRHLLQRKNYFILNARV